VLKPAEALKEISTTQSISKNKSSYFLAHLFPDHFGEHPWQIPFLEVGLKPLLKLVSRCGCYPPEAHAGPQAGFGVEG
jgi:hypothetical protein